jgi:hypothetical protein
VLTYGQSVTTWAEGLELDADVEQVPVDGSLPDDLPELGRPEPAGSTVLLVPPGLDSAAAEATAGAAGAQVLPVTGTDPRADPALAEQLTGLAPDRVLGLGSAFGDDERLGYTVAAARSGVQLPGGGQLILPGKRYIALYGHPGSQALGVLGEQGPQASVARAAELAGQYAAVRRTTSWCRPSRSSPPSPAPQPAPTATTPTSRRSSTCDRTSTPLRHGGSTSCWTCSPATPTSSPRPSATRSCSPARTSASRLDPSGGWPRPAAHGADRQGQRRGGQRRRGLPRSLVRERALPQKMLLLHQFKTFMLEDRASIVADRPELAVVTQMDGHGAPSTKLETWRVILQDPPAGMVFGWKNFYDEDSPTMSPAATMAVQPTPVFVSYQ